MWQFLDGFHSTIQWIWLHMSDSTNLRLTGTCSCHHQILLWEEMTRIQCVNLLIRGHTQKSCWPMKSRPLLSQCPIERTSSASIPTETWAECIFVLARAVYRLSSKTDVLQKGIPYEVGARFHGKELAWCITMVCSVVSMLVNNLHKPNPPNHKRSRERGQRWGDADPRYCRMAEPRPNAKGALRSNEGICLEACKRGNFRSGTWSYQPACRHMESAAGVWQCSLKQVSLAKNEGF